MWRSPSARLSVRATATHLGQLMNRVLPAICQAGTSMGHLRPDSGLSSRPVESPPPIDRSSAPPEQSRWLARSAFVVACAVALAIGSVDITDEGSGAAGGDMARFLMNGAFIHDL